MNTAIDQLAVSLLKKSLHECSEEELQLLAHQYPWFGPAQLLYAKKLQSIDSVLYEEQVQKTALYFQNRLWLAHLLNNNAPLEITASTYVQPVKEETTAIGIPASPMTEVVSPVTDISEPDTTPAIQETEKENAEEAIKPVETTVMTTPADSETADTSIAAAEDASEEGDIHTGDTGTEHGPALQIPGLKTEPMDTNTPLTFEPYHTVDYFASQGIKFREEEKPQDRFGHQLKSFTEWLKTLRRLPASEVATATADPVSEKKVEQMAEHSLAERHVVTEAMAEVWIKQGNRAKAEEIYRKLSLLEPLKTAYFAAKIEDLKKTS